MSISFAATPQAKEAQQARTYTDPSRGAPPSRRSGANAPYIDKDHWNKVFTEPEYFDSIAKQKGMAEGAKVSLFGDDYVYRQAMIGYMSATRGVPLDDMRKVFDVEKDAFAQKNLGKKTASAREMFDYQKSKFERDNEKQAAARQILNNVAQRAITDFATGGDTAFVESVAKDIDAAGDMFSDEEKSMLWEKAEENDMKLRATQMRFAPEAKFIFDALRQTTGEGAGFGAPDMRDMATRFAKLPDKQRRAVYELAGSFAQLNQTDKGFWYQMAESLGRGASDIVERVPRNVKEQALRNDLRMLEGDQPVFAGTGVQGTAYSAFGTTPLTPEEREQAADKVRGELGVFKVERELRDLAERVIDPIKTVTVLPEIVEEGLYGAARSLPYTAVAAVPYAGAPAVAGALYSSNYDRIMLEYPDIDPDKAALIAAISAPIEAGLERMKVNTIMGRLPFFGGLVKRFQHPNQRNITRIAIGGAGVLAEQNAQEILQNATFPFVQMIGSALDKDIPEYNLDLASMPRDLAVQFVALLPLSLMGIGALSHREISRGEAYLRNKDNLGKAGYSEEQIDRITGAATADEAQSILREESKKRDPEKVKAAAQRIVDESIALREKANPAALPRLERQGADYVVLSPEGKELARSTDQTVAEQALVSARRETVQREMRDVHTGINEAIEFIQKVNEARQRGEDIAKVIRENAPRTLLTDYEANPTQENLDRLYETVRAFGQDINEPAKLANFPVIGSNQGALAEGIWKSVIRINEGADGTIVMREFAQDNLERAISEGRTTMDFVRQQLNDVLPQIDSSRIKRQLRTETDTDVIEAFSDVALAYFRGSIREEQIPAGLRGIMRRLAIISRDIFRRAYNLARLRAEGKLDRDFEALLAEAVGVDQQALVDRARERTEQEALRSEGYDGAIYYDQRRDDGDVMPAAIIVNPQAIRVSPTTNYSIAVPSKVDEAAVYDSVLKLAGSRKWDRGRDLKMAMQEAVLSRAQAAGVDVFDMSPETKAYLVRVALRDALFALKQNPNAIGWYDIKTRQALAVMALIHPEIGTDENARFAFTWILAVTSNGLKVDKNFDLAEEVYRGYKKKKVMPTNVGIGTAGKAINNSLKLFNRLSKEWGIDNFRAFTQTTFKVSDISSIDKTLKPSGEFAATEVRGAAIAGPKIGNGFFSNLNGFFDALTMDRWLIRTWGRWTGTLIKAMPEQTTKATERLQKAVEALTSEQASELSAVIGMDIPTATMPDLAQALAKASMDKEIREALNNVSEELRKAGNSLAKYLDGQKEAPSGPAERNNVREIFKSVLDELRATEEYKDLTMADLQAVLWYAEKRLYESAKEDFVDDDETEGYADDEAPDYANAAAKVARDKGVSQARISKSLTDTANVTAGGTRSSNAGRLGATGGQQGAAGGFTEGQKRLFRGNVAVRTVRRGRGSNAAPSWSYSREGSGDGGSVRVLKKIAVKYTASYKAGRDLRRVFRNNGIEAPRFVELVQDEANAQRFSELITASKKASKFGAAVYVYPVSDYQGLRLFLSEDGTTGFALKSNGDIVSVFSTGGAGHGALELAVAEGGTRLDAFDTILPDYYSSHGFVAVSRLNWDDSQAPDGWDKALYKEFNKGEPDVVFMAHQPSYLGWYSQNDGTVYTDYNDAVDAQDRAVADAATGANISTRNYSISTQSEIDRVSAAMDRLARSPSERISQYAALKERLAAALERNQPIMQSMRGDTLPQDFDRTRILNDLGFLDYILKVLPPEVRGRVGGYTNLAAIAPVDVYKGDQKVSEAKNPAGAIISAWMREGQNIGQAQKNTALPEGYSTVANTTDERRDKTVANFLIDRLKKIDRELERYYKRDLMDRIFDVLDKSRPKAGQSGVKRSTLGAETQKFADMVYRASLLDDEQTAERLAAIEAAITSTESSQDSQKRISELSEEWTIVNTFGDLKNRPSETMAYGLEWLQGQLKAGREAWNIKETARIEENRQRVADALVILGKPTDKGRFENPTALKRFLQSINALDLDHKSFEQFATIIFGDKLGGYFSEKLRQADISAAKAELENTKKILNALREGAKAAGTSTGKALVKFKREESNVIRKLEGRKVKNTEIAIDLAKKIVRGLADRGSLSQSDVQTLADELASLPRDTKKQFVTIKQVIYRGDETRISMNRATAMQLWLSWQQSDIQEKMRREGWNDDSAEDLENLLSDPVSQAILKVTRSIYGGGYALTNPIYSRMFGMNMPMVKNYAPARFLNAKEVKDVSLDGSPLTAGGQPSFAKSRVTHSAKIANKDGLTVLQSHIAQQAHWVAFAELTREYRSLLSNPEVRDAITQRYGEDVLTTADMWAEQMEQRGGNKGREIAWINNMLGAATGGQSVSLLGFNLKSLMMQSDNLMRFALALDSRQIASAMSDPAGLMRAIRKVWETDLLQTRLGGGATAETRFLFNRFVSMFRRGAKISELAMMPMNYVDSAGLSISGAIVYQAAFKDAVESGMTEQMADQAAKDAVEAMIYRYGQPVLMGQKSNIENSGNVFAKTFFLFMSDPRLKTALLADSIRGLTTGSGNWKDHVRRIVAVEMMAIVSHVLATAFRDATSDDDDEDLWSMGGFARALLLAPLQGYFLVGSVSEVVLSRLTEARWFAPTQNPFIRTADTAFKAFNNLDDAFNFDDPDALVKEWTNITRSIALTPPLAAPAVVMNLVRPLVQAWERMDDDE